MLTILYWVRQVLGILIGVAFGIVPMQGIMGFGGYVHQRPTTTTTSTATASHNTPLPLHRFAALNAGIPMIYYGKFLEVDQDSYGGGWNLIKEGFMPSTGLFLVNTCVRNT